MGVNTNIILPYEVPADKILDVISKIVGSPYEKKGSTDSIDYNLPTMTNNSWYLTFDSKLEHAYSTMFFLRFQDCIGQTHNWHIHLEDVDNEEGKIISPGSSVIAIAVGRRLVDFFGGHITYKDSDDDIDYENSNPKYLKRTKEQSANDRFYQFYNLLDKEPLLTAKELEFAKEHAAYSDSEFSDKFSHALQSIAMRNRVEDKIKDIPVQEVATQRRKVKV